jgi:hypothetical protein
MSRQCPASAFCLRSITVADGYFSNSFTANCRNFHPKLYNRLKDELLAVKIMVGREQEVVWGNGYETEK